MYFLHTDLILAQELGEKIGRVRNAKWILFMAAYKTKEEVEECIIKNLIQESGNVNYNLKI